MLKSITASASLSLRSAPCVKLEIVNEPMDVYPRPPSNSVTPVTPPVPSTSIVSVASITSSRGSLVNVTLPSSSVSGVCVSVAPVPVARAPPLTSFASPIVKVKSLLPEDVDDAVVITVSPLAAKKLVLGVRSVKAVTTPLVSASTLISVPSFNVISSPTA